MHRKYHLRIVFDKYEYNYDIGAENMRQAKHLAQIHKREIKKKGRYIGLGKVEVCKARNYHIKQESSANRK